MSLNKYNSTSGELEPISQNRMWIGTEAEYSAAVSAGTIGTDMLIYITDDEQGPTDVVEKNNKYAVQSGAVYNAINTVQEQIDDMANSGTVAKNLLPTRGTGTTATSYGITFTVQSDGSVKANGTATGGQALFQCCFATPLNAGESYRLFGGKSTSKFVYANAVNVSTFVKTIGLDVNDPASQYNRNPFTPDYDGYTIVEIGIAINQGQTCNNEIFYPMVTIASNTDGTYVPYSKTNAELTSNVGTLLGAMGEELYYNQSVATFTKTLENGHFYIAYSFGGGTYDNPQYQLVEFVSARDGAVKRIPLHTASTVSSTISGLSYTMTCSTTTLQMGLIKLF